MLAVAASDAAVSGGSFDATVERSVEDTLLTMLRDRVLAGQAGAQSAEDASPAVSAGFALAPLTKRGMAQPRRRRRPT